MRNIVEVANRMLAQVPDSFERKADFERAIEKVVFNTRYKAPEIVADSWWEMAEVLEAFLGNPDTVWKKLIQAIFNDQLKNPQC